MSAGAADERWMRRALRLAAGAAGAGEVPVAAVIVRDEELLAESANAVIARCDPTAHAEILALRAAAAALGNYRLLGTTVYATLEPCAMCAGALVHARVARVVIAAPDPKTGAAGSVFQVLDDPRNNHRPEVCAGVLEAHSRALLQQFFRARRGR